MIKIEPKMLSFANVLVLRWKICDTCEKSLWIQRGREELLQCLKRGETVAPRSKFESSESVHESQLRHVFLCEQRGRLIEAKQKAFERNSRADHSRNLRAQRHRFPQNQSGKRPDEARIVIEPRHQLELADAVMGSFLARFDVDLAQSFDVV